MGRKIKNGNDEGYSEKKMYLGRRTSHTSKSIERLCREVSALKEAKRSKKN